MSVEFKTIQVGAEGKEDTYTIRLLPTTVFLQLQFELDKDGMNPELIKKAITNAAAIGSSEINSERYEKHFRGAKAVQVFDLFSHILEFNLDPEGYDADLGKEVEEVEEKPKEKQKAKSASKD